MSTRNFIHLHLHTTFSFLDGACRVGDVMQTAVENGMNAVAITDHGGMYGAIDFYKAAKSHGVKPIVGCEVYVAPGSRLDRGGDGGKMSPHHLVLLAKNFTGYQNLIRLVSLGYLEGFYYKPRVDKEILSSCCEGLIAMSGCLKGEIAGKLTDGDIKGAENIAGEYSDIFGKDSFFLEIQDHGLPEQRKINKDLVRLSRESSLPLVATNDVHYLKKEHAEAHEVLLCLQTQTTMSDPGRMRLRTPEFYMKNREEMESVFSEIPEALDITADIAEQCNLEFEFGGLHFPTFKVPGGKSQKKYLLELCNKGIRQRYGIRDPEHPEGDREREVKDRVRHEFHIIERAGYINYYLVVWDFVNHARRQDIPVGLRGSGGSSIVAYAIGITDIDPMEYNLVFERFLNLERVSPPDFDIDFCQYRRGDVIDYVKEKYGRRNVAQIITFGSLGAKLAIRDIGRVLDVPYAKCDSLSKMVPDDPKIKLKQALDISSDLKRAYSQDEECRRILDYGFVLEGLYRNPGTHAAGVVIGEKPLIQLIPLTRDKDKQIVTQYSMKPLEEIGLLKMDFLGLRTLTVMHDAVEMVKKNNGIELDLDSIPTDDKPTYDLLNRGDTVGVFQLESSGMRDLIRRVGIGSIEDL
ncbi:MAG: DNA polymerase III subunit alpha, partial [Kiritimatiellia bacterium]